MKRTLSLLLFIGCALGTWAQAPAENKTATTHPNPVNVPIAGARVKDIARVQGARDNQLMGYGLIVGLNATGDSTSTPFTAQALSSMLQRLGITVPAARLKARNVAAVMVTANIPPFVKNGDRIDVTVNSLGDAGSLQGGTLLQTPLTGADGKVYAVAQGSVSLGGYSAGAGGASKTSGHPTVGRVPAGALIEAEIPMALVTHNTLTFSLNNPDFTTATRMTAAINDRLGDVARARDAAAIDITVPNEYRDRVVELIAAVGDVMLVPDSIAKVVINERTGTVVVGGNVTVSPVALAQGMLTVSINPEFLVSQPQPLADGRTVDHQTANVEVTQPEVSLTKVQGSTVDEFVRTLNALKVSPRDVIAILQALKQSGALQAELQIM